MSSNAQLPRQRYIQSMDDYWRLEMEALMLPNSGGDTAADIPTTDEERFRLVDQMVAAFRNTENICDSRADTHGHIRFVEEELTDKSAERMAWKLLVRRPTPKTYLTFVSPIYLNPPAYSYIWSALLTLALCRPRRRHARAAKAIF